MRAGTILFAFVLSLAGCGPSGRAPQPATTAPAAESRPVRLLPATTAYRAVTHLRVEQEFDGRLQVTQLHWAFFLTTMLAPAPGGGIHATIVLDSIEPDPGGTISPLERDRARGARFSGTLLPDGRLDGFTGADSLLPGRLRQLAGGFRQFFPRLPEGGVTPGREWSDSTELTTRTADGDVTIRAHNAYRGGPWTDIGGGRALEVLVTSAFALSGTGSQFGQPFTLQGDGVRSLRQYVTADGRYAGGVATDSASVMVTLTQMGITIPGRQHRTDSLTVVR